MPDSVSERERNWNWLMKVGWNEDCSSVDLPGLLRHM